jgi:hypothetical protein
MITRIRYAVLLGGSLGASTGAAELAALTIGSPGPRRPPRHA